MPTPTKNDKPPVVKFSNYHNIDKVPIVVYADFEAVLLPISSCQPDPATSYSYEYQQHQAYSCGIYVKVDNDEIPASKTTCFKNEVDAYVGEDAASKFMDEIEIGMWGS
ncbi:hypothetical protein PR048_006811 [Dryococelus australis]|uniref:Uncharacterized protein n=1 Tax=Dryococelus australis TaxID=614101 RepID=A0ABQ9ICZ6_9NEOP|nr:hypothetical protein PR048_006811 [Dryococelus australis]